MNRNCGFGCIYFRFGYWDLEGSVCGAARPRKRCRGDLPAASYLAWVMLQDSPMIHQSMNRSLNGSSGKYVTWPIQR